MVPEVWGDYYLGRRAFLHKLQIDANTVYGRYFLAGASNQPFLLIYDQEVVTEDMHYKDPLL